MKINKDFAGVAFGLETKYGRGREASIMPDTKAAPAGKSKQTA